MLSQSTNQGQGTQFHPPMSVASPIVIEAAMRRPVTRLDAAPRPQAPNKKTYCKTCLGKSCIGRCRF